MDKKRKAYAPFSLTSEAVVGQTPVEGYIDVNQMIYPSVDTGVIDENGEWKGVKASDKEFFAFTKDEAVQNGQDIITPTANPNGTWPLDMTGYKDLIIALKTTSTGNYAMQSIMGPDSISFANLSPINAASGIEVLYAGNNGFNVGVDDSAEVLTANVWDFFYIQERLRNQKVLQFKITNNSGGEATIECAFMRIV